jgi:tyrosyl-DNA phosphodiesterase-1
VFIDVKYSALCLTVVDFSVGSPMKRGRSSAATAASCHFDVPLWMNHLPGIPLPASFTAAFPRQRIALSLQDILGGRAWHSVVFSNYMTDLDLLAHQLPGIFGGDSKTRIGIFSGEGDHDHLKAAVKKHKIEDRLCFLKRPRMAMPYGTHHSKFILAFSNDLTQSKVHGDGGDGVRVIIGTPNFIHCDLAATNQAFFVQDFPASLRPKSSPFGDTLRQYLLATCGGKELLEPLQSITHVDFSNASAHLVGSVPGTYRDDNTSLWGMERLSSIIKANTDSKHSTVDYLTWQYSSQGRMSTKYLADLKRCMLPHTSAKALDSVATRIIVPTEEEVRTSIEGWRGGISLPIYQKVSIPAISANLHRFTPNFLLGTDAPTETPAPFHWEIEVQHFKNASETSGRHRATPHIKSYAAVAPSDAGSSHLHWLCVTSSNLSKAAWGEWQLNGTQYMIRSYELGVVFTPGLPPITPSSFSLTPHDPIVPLGAVDVQQHAQVLAELQMCYGAHPVFLGLPANGAQRALFLPYCIHDLVPYNHSANAEPQDVAWAVDKPHEGKDVLGQAASVIESAKLYGEGAWKIKDLAFKAPTMSVRTGMSGAAGRKSHRKESVISDDDHSDRAVTAHAG